MKENVLIVHNYYQIPGGEDVVVANEEKLLKEHGHKVIKYTRSNSELKSMNMLRMAGLIFTAIYNRRTVRDVTRLIKENNIQIVHVHNTLSLISPSVYYAARKCKVPVVQTIHNYRLLCPGATFYRNGHICEECIKGDFTCALKNKCYRNSLSQTLTYVLSLVLHRRLGIYTTVNYIALTDFAKDKFIQAASYHKHSLFDKNRIYVKPNFAQSFDADTGIRKNQFIFAGRLDETKGIDILLEAWKQLIEKDAQRGQYSVSVAPLGNNTENRLGNTSQAQEDNKSGSGIRDYELLVCGEGPLEEYCRSFISENNLTNVKLLGRKEHNDIIRLMSESKAMILPTRWYEGFPMSILESFSVATAVIGPDMGNVGSIIEDGVTGYIYKNNDIESLGSIIGKFIAKDPDMTEDIRKVFNEKYTPEVNYRILKKIYEAVSI